MSIYQNIKGNITTRQAAERYGLQVARNGMTRCPFHDDHTPSLKVDERYHCFGCQADGDVIDFTAKLFGIGNYEAARKLATDFCLSDAKPSVIAQLHNSPSDHTKRQKPQQDEAFCLSVLTDYERLLTQWKHEYAPTIESVPIDDRYAEACQMLPYITYLSDTLYSGDFEQRAFAVNTLMADNTITSLKDRMDRLQEKEQPHDRNEIAR